MTPDVLEVACACGLMESDLAGLAEMRGAFIIEGFSVSSKVPCQTKLAGTGHSSINTHASATLRNALSARVMMEVDQIKIQNR